MVLGHNTDLEAHLGPYLLRDGNGVGVHGPISIPAGVQAAMDAAARAWEINTNDAGADGCVWGSALGTCCLFFFSDFFLGNFGWVVCELI